MGSTAQTHVIEVGWGIGEVRWPSDMANVLALRNTLLVQVCTERSRLQRIFTLCLQFTRMIFGRLDVFRFANLRTHRNTVFGYGMVEACRAIAVDWCAPCELSAESATFNFSSAEGHNSVPFEVGEFKHATSERARWSNLRPFLRVAALVFMALVRPRDYGSLTGGMVDDLLWRHALYSVMHRQSGPSLLCAGQRSKMGLVVARLAEDGLCPRCKEAPENLLHRLWSCRANEQYRLQLNSLVPAAVSFPDTRPRTLARAGIRQQVGTCSPRKSSSVS